jgi:hypothetical protein
VAIVQISRITQRKGLVNDLPEPLASAELGWATDTRQLFIGNGTLAEGAPIIGNTEVLTEFSDILSYSTAYTYRGTNFGLLPPTQTGLTASTPVSQSLQSRLDSNPIITDFGAIGDGVTDVTANINNALFQIYCQNAINPSVRKSLYFPAGTYVISNTLNIPPYCNLYGDGPNSTIISFEVQTWTNTIAYAGGVLVKNNSSYYRSNGAVPIGTAIANTIYWTATTLPSYIFRTADSLQQTGDNIGTNGALQPGSFEISNMKFTTTQVIDGGYIEAAQDCVFESVNFLGPETTSSLTSATNNTACVRFNTTASYVCSNIEFNHCTFSGMVYGTNTAEQIEGVTFSNCAFEILYNGVYLGSDPAPAVGPTGFRIIGNEFNSIYAEGIVIQNVGLNCSAYNVFYDVGNHFLGTAYPYTVVVDINGINNVSVGDMFERTNQYSSGIRQRISLNTTGGVNNNSIALGMNVSNIIFYQNNSAGAVPNNYANQMSLGAYQRVSGITDTLANNAASARTLLTFNENYIKAVRIDYTLVRGTAVRTGTYTIVCGTDASGTNLQGVDDGVQNSASGVTFIVSETSSVISWTYTTTNTGANGTIYYSVTKLA